MTSFSAKNVSTVGVFLLVLAVAHSQNKPGWEVHGDHKAPNIQTLGGSITGVRDKLSVDGSRAGDYKQGHIEYNRQLLTDGTRSLSGHAGLTRDNLGNQAKNFGLGYQDPKTSVNWNREISGPVRTDSFRGERNFYTSPDGRGSLGGYVQHDRNNFGMRNTAGGVVGRYNFG